MIRKGLRRALRATRNFVVGPPERNVIRELISYDNRWAVFHDAVQYINYEVVPGDIVEFGVFGGVSLALLSHAHQNNPLDMNRRIGGFDSFEGLPAVADAHERWGQGTFAKVVWGHPVLKVGEAVTPEAVLQMFKLCRLPAPDIGVGWFHESIPRAFPSTHDKIALLHVDCDLYESTVAVFDGVAPYLQDGCMILFDDWFLFKGHPHKGEARAFAEFLEKHPEWGANHYRAYGTSCNSFILYRK